MTTVEDDVTLKDILVKAKAWLTYIRKKWLVILVFALAGGAIAYAYAYSANKKSNYVATLNFVLDEEKGNGLNAIGLSSLGLGGNDNGIFNSANIIPLMRTQSLIENTLLTKIQIDGKTTTLADMYVNVNGWRNKSNENMLFVNVTDRESLSPEYNSFLKGLYSHIMRYSLSIGQNDKKTSFYQITVLSVSDVFAKALAETLVAETSKEYIDTKIKKAAKTVQILQRQVDSVRSELYGGITGMAQTTDNTFNLNPSLNIARVSTSKKQVGVQVNTIMLGELVKNLEVAKVALLKETPLIQVIDRPRFPLSLIKKSTMMFFIIGAIIGLILSLALLILYRIFSSLSLK